MKKEEKVIWDFIEKGYRTKGKTAEQLYGNLLKELLEQKKKTTIGRDHDLYEVIKEIALLAPQEKLSILRNTYIKITEKRGKGSLNILSKEFKLLIANMVELLFENEDIKILNSFSGTGSLLDCFTEKFTQGEFISEELNTTEYNLQKQLFELCDIPVTVNNVNSLNIKSPEQKYDLIIASPPLNAKMSSSDIKIKKYNDYAPNKMTMEQGFILKSLEQIKDNGIIVGIFAPSFLFSSQNQKIRELLLKETQILSIIETPRNTFTSTAINGAILILKKKESENNSEINNLIMASFAKENIDSQRFSVEKDNLLKEWKSFVQEEVKKC
ncbi:MAG: N-6 DNA methylase [bacterium]